MYEEYFGLTRRPFASVPQPDQYFPAEAIEAARQTLVRCIQRAEGVGLVVGPSGSGKTLLSQVLAGQFRECFKVAVLASGRLSSRRALLQAILFELGQPYRGMDEGELRLALVDYLNSSEDCPNGMVLLVDEAHTLPLRLLEEIRMITNLVGDGQPRTRLALLGGPALEERFASPKLESFSQRIVARCYLESFDRSETQQYIETMIHQAGATAGELVTPEACHAVYQATDGIPRLINQVCDHALLLACAEGRPQIDRSGVEEAWADLQQLPAPVNEPSSEESGGGIIEFGGLDDELADDPTTVPMLRVADDVEDQMAVANEPAQQVAQIQEALSQLDDDFEPAGSIGPEIELAFDDDAGPFSEPFEEEEVVADRVVPPARVDQEEQHRPLAGNHLQHVEPAAEPSFEQTAHRQEHELIVVEDEYDDADEPQPAIVPVRRQEYCRLFTTLRGSG